MRTSPLRIPRTMRRSLSTATTRYFWAKIEVSVFSIFGWMRDFIEKVGLSGGRLGFPLGLIRVGLEGCRTKAQKRRTRVTVRHGSDWSELNSLLGSDVAFCGHESQADAGSGGSLSHMWGEARGEVRAGYGATAYGSAPGSPVGGVGGLGCFESAGQGFGP